MAAKKDKKASLLPKSIAGVKIPKTLRTQLTELARHPLVADLLAAGLVALAASLREKPKAEAAAAKVKETAVEVADEIVETAEAAATAVRKVAKGTRKTVAKAAKSAPKVAKPPLRPSPRAVPPPPRRRTDPLIKRLRPARRGSWPKGESWRTSMSR
ncbi:MAG: hypothetical protein WDN44_14075 [Sphingomonas sp.]